jgi:uncharacterized protein YkwD
MRSLRTSGRRASGHRLAARATTAIVTAAVLTGVLATPAHSAPADRELRFLEMINGLRADRGLSKLRPDPELQSVAAAWSRKMAAAGRLTHNPNLATEYRGPWRKLGENVGRGSSAEEIEQAFEASPAHLRNLVDPEYDSLAVAVVEVGDTVYVTQQFRASGLPNQGANGQGANGQGLPDELAGGADRGSPASRDVPRTTVGATPLAIIVPATRRPSSGAAPPTSSSVLAARPNR